MKIKINPEALPKMANGRDVCRRCKALASTGYNYDDIVKEHNDCHGWIHNKDDECPYCWDHSGY